MKQRNVVLLHGRWPEKIGGQLIANIPLINPNNSDNWMGWIKKQLEERGYTVSCPIITEAWKAPYEQWRTELDKTQIDQDTTLVGWSAGGYAILRYLGESGKRVKKVILVAPGSKYTATNSDPLPSKEEFYHFQITPELKKQFEEKIVFLVSNDSPEVLKSVEMYKEVLGAKVITLKDMGHFSFLVKELPELLAEIVNSDR